MASTGFYNYFQKAGLNSGVYNIHFSFNDTGIGGVISSAPQTVGNYTAVLSSIGNFFSSSGSGNFTGQTLSIQNASGLNTASWSQLFIFERATKKGGYLFDSIQAGAITSGYRIGINDNNKLFFEYYTNQGYTSRTSNVMYGAKNAVAVVKNANAINFACYDFNTQSFNSDAFLVNNTYLLPSSTAVIGAGLSGYIDEYVYISQTLSPVVLSQLFSGFYSSIQTVTGNVSGFQTNEITGYLNQITGTTGITGYQISQTSSGLDPFGDPIYTYTQTPITGYFTSGLNVIPLTGLVNHYITGDPFQTYAIDFNFVSGFGLDEVSYKRSIYPTDYSYLKTVSNTGNSSFNRIADYDSVKGQFELDSVYLPNQVSIFINGISQINSGYSVTGNFYSNGVVVSGDYMLTGFLVNSTGFYLPSDTLIFDVASETQQRVFSTGAISGISELITINKNQLIFLNGVLLVSGVDYVSDGGGNFKWNSNLFNGASGSLFAFTYSYGNYSEYVGTPIMTGINRFSRNTSQFYLNGQRQLFGKDYLENSSIDLIGQSGIFDVSSSTIYNNDGLFFYTVNISGVSGIYFDSQMLSFDSNHFTFDHT